MESSCKTTTEEAAGVKGVGSVHSQSLLFPAHPDHQVAPHTKIYGLPSSFSHRMDNQQPHIFLINDQQNKNILVCASLISCNVKVVL